MADPMNPVDRQTRFRVQNAVIEFLEGAYDGRGVGDLLFEKSETYVAMNEVAELIDLIRERAGTI